MKKLLLLLSLLIPATGYGAGATVKTITQSYQNYLINGGFDLWQRGSANANVDSGGYLADRWFATAGTYDQISANLPTGVKYGAQLAFSSSSGWLCQRIEAGNTLQFSGQKMTISGYERSSTGTGAFKIKIDRPNTVDDYGSGARGKLGTTTTSELAATTLLATTSSTLAPWNYTFTVSANMASYGFQVCLGTDTSTTTTYQYSAVTLAEGPKAAPFRRIGTVAQELSLAFRYYEAGSGSNHAYDFNGSTRTPWFSFHTRKRQGVGLLTVTCSWNWFNVGGGGGAGSCGPSDLSDYGISLGTSGTGYVLGYGSWIANAEL